MRARVVMMAVVVALASSARPRKQSTNADAVVVATTLHRERARQVLEVHCGLCHLPPDIGGGTGMALPIYDLSAIDWSETLSDAQLPIVEHKLHDDGADAAEEAIMHTFVVDELLWRDGHPDLYPQDFRDRPPRAP